MMPLHSIRRLAAASRGFIIFFISFHHFYLRVEQLARYATQCHQCVVKITQSLPLSWIHVVLVKHVEPWAIDSLSLRCVDQNRVTRFVLTSLLSSGSSGT